MDINKLITCLQKEEKILTEIRNNYPFSINQIQKLEAKEPHLPIKDILSLIAVQKKFQQKIENVEKLIITDLGGQQASSSELAKYHAEKFAEFETVADLCCGNGIDLIYLARSKKQVYAVDLNADTLEIAKYNCRASDINNVVFLIQKAEEFQKKVEAIYADPDRRPANQRKIKPDELNPTLQDIMKLNKITGNIAVKLSPAMDYQKLALPPDCTLEFISEKGTMKEILLCLGKLSTSNTERKAVLLPQRIEICNSRIKLNIEEINKYIFEPDSAIIRGGLVQECGNLIGYNLIDKKLALLTGGNKIKSELGNCYRVRTIFAYDLKALHRYCRRNDIGEIIIKTRGFPMSVEELRKKIKVKGTKRIVLFIIRKSDNHQMILADRL